MFLASSRQRQYGLWPTKYSTNGTHEVSSDGHTDTAAITFRGNLFAALS